jgi:hypothetical protein
MKSAAPFLAAEETAHPSKREDLWDLAEACLQQTAEALHQARAATPVEIATGIAAVRQDHARQKPSDLVETLARITDHHEEHLSPVILEFGTKIAQTLTPYPPLIPFCGKLIVPTAFYDSFEQIRKISRILLAPVIFAEDTDAIGVASVNPVAASIMAEEIRTEIYKQTGIRPFITLARLDYDSWTFITRKHFVL